MQLVNKSYIYKQLNTIHDKYKVDINEYVAKMIRSNEIPYEVITFVNTYTPINELRTYNEIRNKRNNSNLFRNILKNNNTVVILRNKSKTFSCSVLLHFSNMHPYKIPKINPFFGKAKCPREDNV